MVPHDQHPGVAFSANWLDGFPGIINDDLDSTFAIKKFKASARPALSAFDHLVWQGATSPTRRGESPSPHELLRERTAAAAGLCRVRVYKDEALLHERFVVIENHPVQIYE